MEDASITGGANQTYPGSGWVASRFDQRDGFSSNESGGALLGKARNRRIVTCLVRRQRSKSSTGRAAAKLSEDPRKLSPWELSPWELSPRGLSPQELRRMNPMCKSEITRAVIGSLLVLALSHIAPTAVEAGFMDCGQPVSSGARPVATDALFVLRVAVGSETCEPCVCDVNSSGGIQPVTSTDALLTLRAAVISTETLNCEPCSTSCDNSEGPTCGGDCEGGQVCAPDTFDEQNCRCSTPCEISAAPACAETCRPEDGGGVCTYIQFSSGGQTTDSCVCAPENISLCGSAAAPQCFGVCAPGQVCESDGGGCSCTTLPQQGPCGAASPPICGGTCGAGEICEPGVDGCECGTFTDQFENCEDAEFPVCNGACANGTLCGTNIGGECRCLEPCELSAAPSCGGDCTDPSASCEFRSATLDGEVLEFCECN